jgi:membrane protein
MTGLVARPKAWGRRLLAPYVERLVEVELFDRAVALASQAFVALIPFMVVAAAVMPYDQQPSFAESIVSRFHLSGDSADAVETLFASPKGVTSTLSALGLFLMVVSALSFCRAMQRLYEKAWRLPARGVRSSSSHLIWLAVAAVYASIGTTLNTTAAEWLGPTGRLVVGFALSYLLWMWTPYLLLGRRIERRALRATGILTAVGMTAFSAASLFYMPHSIESSAGQFGSIGIAIALVSWLIGAGFVLVISAALGAVLAGGPMLQREPQQTER